MKPDEDMHAAVEEVDIDPCDLYTDLGTLIVEGRIPGLTDRGFGEGPHCCPSPHAQHRHQCEPSAPPCQKYDQMLKHMLLLFKNGIPMTIEVLLYPSCCPDTDSTAHPTYLLLEQWTIHMLPRRVPDASISPRGLIQAVRSFLYFSQLCAWYSLTGGKSPQNVHYRVCVPGEAFSSKFSAQPDCHMFPLTNVGRNAAMKVVMKCHPRCGEIPDVPCLKHSLANKKYKNKTSTQTTTTARDFLYDGILPIGSSRTNSPADSMLGESLLDPPNSLCMYPKRYQSPSRCGSPSMEVPEHLMFGKREETPPSRRSRTPRRPVVERFLKKESGEETVSNRTCSKKLKDLPVVDAVSFKRDHVLSYCCIEEDMKRVSPEEMEEVLERLRERQSGVKCTRSNSPADTKKCLSHQIKTLPHLMDEMKISSRVLEQQQSKDQHKFYKSTSPCDSKNLFMQALRHNKESSNSRKLEKDTLPYDKQTDYQQPNHLLTNKLNVLQSPDCHRFASLSDNRESCCENQRSYQTPSSTRFHPSSVNIKKCGCLLYSESISDEREICDIQSEVKPISSQVTSPSSSDSFSDDVFRSGGGIPSADQKALFRRSLDSATSLVFHQRSGLPLTSSPAPIRKSGTCFDFDSSLTSVSAIKRALFDKEEEEIQEECFNLSAPASTTASTSSLLGTFEESVLNGRLEPVSTVEGFTAEIGASGSFCPRHITLPVTVFFYTLQDMDKVTSPYMGHINLRNQEYHIPKKGTVQVTLFNPHQTVVKMFVVRYDLCDMPTNSQTFLRQRTLYMPTDASEDDEDAQKWLRYLVHLRFMSSKSGRIYLHTDIRVIIFRKSDLDAATVHGQRPYELRSVTNGPLNPKFSSHKPLCT